MIARAVPILLIAFVACRDRAVAIRVGNSDTILVHSRGPVTLPARLVDAQGREVSGTPMRYTLASGTVLRQMDTASVQCTAPGDAALRISSGTLQSDFVVRCRPIKYIAMKHIVDLVVGGPSEPLDISAMGIDGRAIEELGLRATVRDTSVAVVRDGRIYPQQPGSTVIEISVGCETWMEVRVHAKAVASESMAPNQIFMDKVALESGDHRFWRLPPGDFHVEITSDSGAGPLALSTFKANCTEDRVAPGHYTCRTQAGGSVVLRPASSRAAAGRITMLRTDGPPLPPVGALESRRIPSKLMCAEVLR